MMKIILFLSLFTSGFLYSQLVEFGVGIRGNFNILSGNENYVLPTQDAYGDTVYLRFNQHKMSVSYNIPVFVRYKGRKGFWGEFSLTREKLIATGTGFSNYSDSYLMNYSQNQMLQDYSQDPLLQQAYPIFNDFYTDYSSQYFSRAKESWKEDLEYVEETQYNNIAITCGYTFLRTKKFRPFIMAGLEWNAKSYKNNFQSLKYRSSQVDDFYSVYQSLPQLKNHIFYLNFGAGLEMFDMHIGLHIRQSLGNIRSVVGIGSIPQDDYYKYISSVSVYLKYSLFKFNIRSREDREKLKKEELKVLGDYTEKNKIIKLTTGAEVSVFSNVNSPFENSDYSDSVPVANSGFYLYENIRIENQRIESGSNAIGDFTTDTAFTTIGLGNIKQINMFPNLRFNMEIEPIKYVSFEIGLAYQYSAYDTEARLIKSYYDWEAQADQNKQYHTVFRQTFNRIALSARINLKYDVAPDFFIGINGGFNFNYSIVSKHKFEYPGFNADPLLFEFDKYFVRDDNSKDWNQENGNGDPNDRYTYEKYDENLGTYTPIPSSDLMNGFKGKFWTTWTVGIDFYYDKLRISPFVEGRVTDLNFLYQDFLRLGVGFYFYLRK